ncbi:MAG: hypothetical protein LJE85_05200 [Gammaproteobacteria bacterium]|nr:hypothetical protein [Gammaproteobacteria bacterium]
MSYSTSTKHYVMGDHMIYKQEISMNLATDGFRFVAHEQQWSEEQTERVFAQLGDINQRLTDADCQEFLAGVQNCIHDSELLYQHVTNFTHKMLQKWGVDDN